MTATHQAHGGIAISTENGWMIWSDADDQARGIECDAFVRGWLNRRAAHDAILATQETVLESHGVPSDSPLFLAQ